MSKHPNEIELRLYEHVNGEPQIYELIVDSIIFSSIIRITDLRRFSYRCTNAYPYNE